ncbi:GntR family transcriptional regulator [Rugosimonospora acidiphila]|uniref:GntR family transcriptional regulator n=1 Tax=Rugosimonospora acidiphila TaxID=556531 RepID=A0ABP9RQN3_9ACTN
MARRETAQDGAQARLRELIAAELRPGDRLPNERELAARLAVSRATMREAIGALVAAGEVLRTWGVGTFVREPPAGVPVSLGEVIALRDKISATGHRPALHDASVGRVPCPDDCAEALGCPPGAPMWRVDRLFAVDGVPAAWIRDHLPLSVAGRDLDPSSLVSIEVDLLEFLARVTGVPVRRTDIDMAAVLAEGDAVDRLAVPAGHPLMSAVQLGVGEGNLPLFHGHILVRTDVLTLRITRRG